ncbi:MAG: PD-(D/E)XK nuclease family protein, partial [Acidovorax sp.]
MTVIAKNDHCAGVLTLWQDALGGVAATIQRLGAHPARTVVLVPYAQLMPWAQHYWGLLHPDGFAPRFETTLNWARQIEAFLPQGDDLAGDMGRDTLTARGLLDRAGLTAQRDMLAAPLQEAASQLATVVASVRPHERDAWTRKARLQLPGPDEASALRFEAAVARIALEWAAASRYATDVLFEPDARHGVDALIVLQGFQTDLLAATLLNHWGERGLLIPLAKEPGGVHTASHIALHRARDAEDEAQRAAACVLAHVSTGRVPVALASNDRALTRRISAHLAHRGVAVRDENGWTLSTTRSAAQLMAALKAAAWDASSDDVLDWLKQVPLIDPGVLAALERDLRRFAIASWSGVVGRDWGGAPALAALVTQVTSWREGLRTSRALGHWLAALRGLLRATGLWELLERDAAGARVLSALRLQEGQDAEFDGWSVAARRVSLHEFTRWVNEVLEYARFRPPFETGAPVTV